MILSFIDCDILWWGSCFPLLSGIEDRDGLLSEDSFLKSVVMMLSFLKPRAARKNWPQTWTDSLAGVFTEHTRLYFLCFFGLSRTLVFLELIQHSKINILFVIPCPSSNTENEYCFTVHCLSSQCTSFCNYRVVK